MEIIADGYVCSDCLFMLANGEIAPDASEARVEDVAEATAGWCQDADNAEHPEQDFATSPCRTCRSLLYGSRHWAVKLA